jgi:hypothetical protein
LHSTRPYRNKISNHQGINHSPTHHSLSWPIRHHISIYHGCFTFNFFFIMFYIKLSKIQNINKEPQKRKRKKKTHVLTAHYLTHSCLQPFLITFHSQPTLLPLFLISIFFFFLFSLFFRLIVSFTLFVMILKNS